MFLFLGVVALSLSTAGLNLKEVKGRETGSPAASVVFPEEGQQRGMLTDSHRTVLGCSLSPGFCSLEFAFTLFLYNRFHQCHKIIRFSVPVSYKSQFSTTSLYYHVAEKL